MRHSALQKLGKVADNYRNVFQIERLEPLSLPIVMFSAICDQIAQRI
jgi:hypothetical protein